MSIKIGVMTIEVDGEKFEAEVEARELTRIGVEWKVGIRRTRALSFECLWWKNESEWTYNDFGKYKDSGIPEHIKDIESRLNVWCKENPEAVKKAFLEYNQDDIKMRQRNMEYLKEQLRQYEEGMQMSLDIEKKIKEIYKS